MASTSGISTEPVEQPTEVDTGPVADVPAGSGDSHQESLPHILDVQWQRQGMPDTDFNRKYPPDAWGEEMSPNARVWKVYRDHQTLLDKGRLESWNKSLDVLLIFAGLFSAVLTAFLIESYKALQPDYTQYVAVFLYAAAVSNNRTGGVFPALDTLVAPDHFIQTSAAQRWTNGLWFSSLVVSLAVALLCILIKQWLDAYDSHISAAASPRHWARRHSMYHRGLKTWGVPVLISFLPLLLHLSLFLFLVGLILFLRPLDGAISHLLIVMVFCIGAFYVLALVLPAWRVECPSYTPLVAQVLITASKVISALLYVIRPPNWRVSLAVHRMLNALAIHQQARETSTINMCEHEQDGFVLNTLIHLYSHANLDVISTAITAIGAVTSTRTMEVICRKALCVVLRSGLSNCDEYIPLTQTGFAITSRARLRRAYWTLVTHERSLCHPIAQYGSGLLSPLGIDGLLLEALDFRNHDDKVDVDHLIPLLQSLAPSGKRSRSLPLRSTCLTLLEHFSSRHYENSGFLSCFLLVFCAGRFGSADRHELVRALRTVASVLRMHCSITVREHEGEDPEYICAVLNGLWVILADFARYHVAPLTAQIVARQAVVCFPNQDYTIQEQMWGLARFIRSPTFGQCVGLDNTLTEYWRRVQVIRMHPEDYWTSIATLLRLCFGCGQGRKNEENLFECRFLFKPYLSNGHIVPPRDVGGQCQSLEDWYELGLSAFLDSPNAITTWTRANSLNFDYNRDLDLVMLAHRMSILLCRRQRLGRANDALIRGFFSGTFLLARFQDLVSRHPPNEGSARGLERLTLGLASHCLKLSTQRFMAIIAQLEETGDAGSELRASAAALEQKLRDGSMPGGELSGECAADCLCMIRSTRADAECGWGDVWNDLRTRLRRGCSASGTAEHV